MATIHFNELDLVASSAKVSVLNELIEYWVLHYSKYKNIYFGPLPGHAIYYISTSNDYMLILDEIKMNE